MDIVIILLKLVSDLEINSTPAIIHSSKQTLDNKMQIIKMWDIQVWDGGDRTNHKYFVATKAAAEEWLKNNTYDSVYEKEIIILDSYAELMDFKNGEAKKRALATLTEEDKVVLGLT